MLSKDQSVRKQHIAVREQGGWYDFTHRLVDVTGEDSIEFLEYIFAGSIAKTPVGKAKYTVMLAPDATIQDDVIIFRLEENHFWISTLYSRFLLKWLESHKGSRQVEFKEITSEWRMFSVQGPLSTNLANAICEKPVDDLKFFRIEDNFMGDVPIKIARSGYTGEKNGYEIYIASDKASQLVEKLSAEGDKLGLIHVTEIDVMCMTLACEKGFVLMLDLWQTNPCEVGFENSIAWDTDFIGKEALARICDEGAKRELLGIQVDDLGARIYGGPHGATVIGADGSVIGKVTKYTFSPTLDKSIGYILIDKGSAPVGSTVTINGVPAKVCEKRIIP